MTPSFTPERVVAGAAIVSNGRVLAARRSEPASLAGRWEFPGGKAEHGETLAQACVREIREELGCEIRIVGELAATVPVSQGYVLRVAVARLVGGEPLPLEHDAIRWLSADELGEVDWLPADLPFLPEVRALLHQPAVPGSDL
jgi:8-oxo-dGTP diphosphatase